MILAPAQVARGHGVSTQEPLTGQSPVAVRHADTPWNMCKCNPVQLQLFNPISLRTGLSMHWLARHSGLLRMLTVL